MVHSKEIHNKNVNELCRVCGCMTLTFKEKQKKLKPIRVDNLLKKISFITGYSLKEGDDFSHFVCRKCYKNIDNASKRCSNITRDSLITLLAASDSLWVTFDENIHEDECMICNKRKNLIGLKSLTQKKAKVAVTTVSLDTTATSSASETDHLVNDNSQLTASVDHTHTLKDRQCEADDIAVDSDEECVQAYIDFESKNDQIQSDTLATDSATACASSSVTSDIMCSSTGGIHDVPSTSADIDLEFEISPPVSPNITSPMPICVSTPVRHKSTPRKEKPMMKDAFNSPKDKYFETMQNSLDRSFTQPLDETESRLATKYAKRMINESEDKSQIRFKTRGQPMLFVRAVKARKNLDVVCRQQRSKRLQTVDVQRKLSKSELDIEVSAMPKTKKEQLLSKVRGSKKVKVSMQRALRMKVALGLSLRGGRLLFEELGELDCSIKVERKQINMTKEIVKDFVIVGNKLFLNDDLSVKSDVPFAMIKDLPVFVNQHLDHLDEKGLLIWDAEMNKDHVSIKIGADHGKNHLKFTLEVMNTPCPNSKENTVVIAMASVKDTYENLKTFLEGGTIDDRNNYQPSIGLLKEIEMLQRHKWRGKQIKLSLNGDYSFLCNAYGISGATGSYPCIWCLVKSSDLEHPKDDKDYEERSISSITEDHIRFKEESDGNKAVVKHYNNALHAPLLPIELEDVTPPYLHIVLGLVWRHHVLLLGEIHQLEIELINQSKGTCKEKGLELREFGKALETKESLEEQLRHIDSFINCSETEVDLRIYGNLQTETEHKLADLTFQKLDNKSKGPIATSMEKVLSSYHITPQSYHGGAFTGNHCHNYIKKQVYKALTAHAVAQAKLYTYDMDITDRAHMMEDKFNDINESLYKVHDAISGTKAIKNDDLCQIQTDINIYIQKYTKYFPGKILPKQHILHKHCVPYIRRHGYALGRAGEQGTESSHQTISRIEKRATAIINKHEKLKFIMTTQLLNVSPVLRNLKEKKKRKRKNVHKQ